jgi:hypothetical protein
LRSGLLHVAPDAGFVGAGAVAVFFEFEHVGDFVAGVVGEGGGDALDAGVAGLHEEVCEVDAFAGLDFDADEGVVAGGVGDLLPAGEDLIGAGFEEVADVVEGFDAGFDEEAVVDVAEPAGLFVDALGVGGGGFDGVDEVEHEDVFVGTGAEAEGIGFVGAGFDEGGFVEEFEGFADGAGVLVGDGEGGGIDGDGFGDSGFAFFEDEGDENDDQHQDGGDGEVHEGVAKFHGRAVRNAGMGASASLGG